MVKKIHNTATAPAVAANGFILPPNDPVKQDFGTSSTNLPQPPHSPSSFSVNGIAASSPVKRKTSQVHALNEGRDFLDILEACRPRNSGAIPSALQALLMMYRRGEKTDRVQNVSDNDESDDGEADELKPLKEWTSMDLDLEEPFKSTRARSGSFGMQENNVRPTFEYSDSSALSSPSSSYTSQMSGYIGVSYDRHMLGKSKVSATLGGIQLQRSQSLQYDTCLDNAADTETVQSDGSWSTMDQGSDDDAQSRGAKKERDKHAEQIRAMIASHDSNYFADQEIAQPTPQAEGGRPMTYTLNDSTSSLSPVGGVVLQPHR